jgi:hypothetical protein
MAAGSGDYSSRPAEGNAISSRPRCRNECRSAGSIGPAEAAWAGRWVNLNATVVPAANASAPPNTINLDISDPHQICPSAATYDGRFSGAL